MTRITNNSKLLEAAKYTSNIMGRHVLDQGAVRIDWPGVRLEFDGPFQGTSSIRIRMIGRGATFGYRLTPIGEEQTDLHHEDKFVFGSSRKNKMKDYPLLSSSTASPILDPNKAYKLSIWKMGDPCGGGSTIAGLVVGNACTAVPPEKPCNPLPLPGRKLIEFVGDSNTVGYGIKGKRSGFIYHVTWEGVGLKLLNAPQRKVKTTDVTKSWAPRVANALDADYNITAWSGIGTVHSPWGLTNMTAAYGNLVASDPTTHVKELPGPQPDAVVVMIGQNDTVNTITNPERLQASFSTLLKEIRKYRPAPIPILIVVPTPDTSIACVMSKKETKRKAVWLNQVWKSVVETTDLDSTHIHVIENTHEPAFQPQEDVGMFLHWNESGNEKWARGLPEKVQSILEWDEV